MTYGSLGLVTCIGALYLPGIPDLTWYLGDVGLLWFGACVAVAMLRYRLYDIDVIVNRTLVYGTVTAGLGAVYAALAVGLGSVAGRDNSVVIAGSTLVVAALFGPARRRVQSTIDRRFFRRKYDAARPWSNSGRDCGTTSTSPTFPATWSAWCTRPCSRPRSRCGCGRGTGER